ncbi:PH domain-containing protein [Bacillus sp. B1-b2]|uniref:PH domain-containing protein n=1 Tax=Bacillus sp. B1-b2 TaxID=2653201 RepID=UPI0012628723|nr:PH domain-containing protein [Bacillus sp. B1-b2]KAB7663454.1 PH domain-containing protein [Bacillus sp. B1-b2]
MILEPQNRLSKRGIKVWRLTGLVSSIILFLMGGGYITLSIIFDWYKWITVVTVLFLVIYSYLVIILLPKLKWLRWRYEVREDEIEIQQGVVIVKKTLIPMIRVQHVDLKQGPFLRKYELATISVSTAATVHEIPVLEMQEATEMRHFISNKAKVAKEDV